MSGLNGAGTPDAKIPSGPIAERWDSHKHSIRLVNPANKRRFHIIVVGSGLAGVTVTTSRGSYQNEV